jgi:chromosome partitioning protein
MSYIISVSSSKGGPGKTTTVANMADCFSLEGKKVAVLDTDPNENFSRWYSKGTYENAFKNVDLIQITNEEMIIEEADKAALDHDVVLIDVAGVKSKGLLYAAGISDLVVIPAQPSEDDIDEAIKTVREVQNAAKLSRRNIKYRVLLTQTRKGTIVLEHAAKQFEDLNGIKIFRATIGQREIHKQARFHGTTAMRMEPKGLAAKEYSAFTKELVKFLKEVDGAEKAASKKSKAA